MFRKTLILVAAALMAASAGHSQTGKKKNEPGEVEMTFANGSLVRMTLVPEKIEISTPYGKLSVPTRDIRRIDFGLHLPEGADKKIEAAIKQLGNADYQQRESAVQELVALGAYAYPALLQAARSGELETAKRAQDALSRIRAKVPTKELRLGEDDTVVTPRFTIVGRILPTSIKAKSEYFGEVELPVAKLRHLRLLVDPRDSDVAVDAGKYAQPNQWLDTGIVIEGPGNFAIVASGEVELRPSQPGTLVCGPRGYTRDGGPGAGMPAGAAAFGAAGFVAKGKKGMMVAVGRAYPGTLLGRIGENGDTFVIGDRFEGVADRDGKLYLQIMSSPYENVSAGSYQVKVIVRE
ncbi:MAG: hypothetical protein L0Y72_00970 [Gemmataceae bacterium]|nr:hypothetical protein [Gemmataceae bacterium]MCI0737583.1 hypothetical protein [Gemmataceae bacterium]